MLKQMKTVKLKTKELLIRELEPNTVIKTPVNL